MLYLYGLLPRDAAVDPPARGIRGAPVVGVRATTSIAWVSTLPSTLDPPIDAGMIAEHIAVLDAPLGAGVTPLPARPGQTFPSEERLLAELDRQGAAVARGLARVERRCEMVVRLRLRSDRTPTPAAPVEAAGPGRAYLERLREEDLVGRTLREGGESLRHALRERLSGLIDEDALGEPTMGTHRSITLAHLVSRKTLPQYRRRLRAALVGGGSIDAERWAWAFTGPIPPFSFASWDNEGPTARGGEGGGRD